MATSTEKSAWTPICNKILNDKLFEERMALLSKWYSAWTDDQKWELVEFVLLRLSDKDLRYIYSLLDPLIPRPPPPEIREDFTRLLPRSISLEIFSYLDARSLCRAAQVSWYWRYLSEQNILWKPKCLRYGWFLPTPPTQSNPVTVWKRHYVTCVGHITWRLPQVMSPSPDSLLSPPSSPLPSLCTHNTETICKFNSRRSDAASNGRTGLSLNQPTWRHPSRFPKELRSNEIFTSSLTSRRPSSRRSSTSVNCQRKAFTFHPLINQVMTIPSDHNHVSSEKNIEPGVEFCQRPSVDIDALIQPELLEKLRLGQPREETILVSTICHPEREDKRKLAVAMSQVQSDAPFPPLPPYYQERSEKDCEREKIELLKYTKKEETVKSDDATTAEWIREWRDEDFNTDSDSDS